MFYIPVASICLPDNSPTHQLAVSQVADWSTRGLVSLPKCLIYNF